MPNVEDLVEWLVQGVPGARTPMDVLARLLPGLADAGLPLQRVEAFVRTLHPHIVGRSFLWHPGQSVSVRENSYAYLHSTEFMASPVAKVFATGEWQRRRRGDPPLAGEEPFVEWLTSDGLSDFVAAPLAFLSGQVHAITFATERQEGFSEADVAALERVIPPLARIAEILALSRTAVNLLDTYVGHNAGERILAGKIRRGDMEPIQAVIWLSDLRGFTSLASSVNPGELIGALNELFECQVSAIVEHGGEVLKFMGDGLLAIFPIVEGGKPPKELCAAALEAVSDASRDLRGRNASRLSRGETELNFGLGLHVGEVVYGNIGGAYRLDFTCIGPAVNLAARLEGVASKLGRAVVASEEFVKIAEIEAELLGEFELKGVPKLERVYAIGGRAQANPTAKPIE